MSPLALDPREMWKCRREQRQRRGEVVRRGGREERRAEEREGVRGVRAREQQEETKETNNATRDKSDNGSNARTSGTDKGQPNISSHASQHTPIDVYTCTRCIQTSTVHGTCQKGLGVSPDSVLAHTHTYRSHTPRTGVICQAHPHSSLCSCPQYWARLLVIMRVFPWLMFILFPTLTHYLARTLCPLLVVLLSSAFSLAHNSGQALPLTLSLPLPAN